MGKSKWIGTCAWLAIACGMSSPALAQESGGYLGFSLGQAEAKGYCSDTRDIVVGFFGGTVSSCDQKDSAFKIFGGYRVNRNLAIEGSYFDYGEYPARVSIAGNAGTLTGEATAFGAAAVGIIPLNNQFSLFGKAGLLMTDISVTAVGPGGVGTASDDETGLHLGFGALFNIGNFGIRAEWERNDEADIDMLSLGLQVRF
jgi:OOP family OmpA-OmpF porin